MMLSVLLVYEVYALIEPTVVYSTVDSSRDLSSCSESYVFMEYSTVDRYVYLKIVIISSRFVRACAEYTPVTTLYRNVNTLCKDLIISSSYDAEICYSLCSKGGIDLFSYYELV